jgi:hypothetical protein
MIVSTAATATTAWNFNHHHRINKWLSLVCFPTAAAFQWNMFQQQLYVSAIPTVTCYRLKFSYISCLSMTAVPVHQLLIDDTVAIPLAAACQC